MAPSARTANIAARVTEFGHHFAPLAPVRVPSSPTAPPPASLQAVHAAFTDIVLPLRSSEELADLAVADLVPAYLAARPETKPDADAVRDRAEAVSRKVKFVDVAEVVARLVSAEEEEGGGGGGIVDVGPFVMAFRGVEEGSESESGGHGEFVAAWQLAVAMLDAAFGEWRRRREQEEEKEGKVEERAVVVAMETVSVEEPHFAESAIAAEEVGEAVVEDAADTNAVAVATTTAADESTIDVVGEKTAPGTTPVGETITDDGVDVEGVTEASSTRVATEEVVAQETAPELTVADGAPARDTAPEDTVDEDGGAVANKNASADRAITHTASEGTAPGETAAEGSASEEVAVEEVAVEEVAAEDTAAEEIGLAA